MFLEVKNITKTYKKRIGLFKTQEKTVLHNVSFHVSQGEIFSIIGQSGAGKSTIGKILMRIDEPTSGTVEFLGRPLRDAKISDIQMIFQDPYNSLNPEMTVRQILAEPLRGMGIKDKDEIERRVTDIMADVWLDEKHGAMYPEELSGGQRQRVGIGAAMITNPKLVICDEPVASLDLHIQNQILSLLKKFNRENNTTIIFISHDLGVVYNISDRVLALYNGEIQEIQSTVDFFEHPKSVYGKYFIGNLVKF